MSTTHKNDSLLVQRYIQGDEKALSILLKKHQSYIFNFILSKVKNRTIAEDIFQETFIKIINTLKSGKYNEQGKFLPYVLRISYNLTIDYFRANKKMPNAEIYLRSEGEEISLFDLIKGSDESVEDILIKDQINEDLSSLIEYLPKEQKKVLIQRFYKDMSFKDIGEANDISINTALGRMRYAIINLRKLIEENKINLTLK